MRSNRVRARLFIAVSMLAAATAVGCRAPQPQLVSTGSTSGDDAATQPDATSAAASTDAGLMTLGPNGDATRLALDITHSCMVKQDASLICWGTNTSGEVDGHPSAAVTGPIPVPAGKSWALVALGAWHSCGLTTHGALWCWGDNRAGELGVGSTATTLPPTRIGTEAWTSVAGGQSHTCAIRKDGTLWCWGRGDSGQLGDPSAITEPCTPIGWTAGTASACAREPQRVGSDADWVSVTAGGLRACALKRAGTLYCWGARSGITPKTLTPTRVGTDTDWSSAAVDGDIGCGLKRNGQAKCWMPSGLQLGSQTWVSLSVGAGHACALATHGKAACWGDNQGGTIGDGTTMNAQAPVSLPDDVPWTLVTAGGWHSCGVRSDGSVQCWGSNAYGQLGDGETSHASACGGSDCSTTPVTVNFKTP